MHNEVDETRTKTDLVRGPARAHDEKMSVPYLSRAGKKKNHNKAAFTFKEEAGKSNTRAHSVRVVSGDELERGDSYHVILTRTGNVLGGNCGGNLCTVGFLLAITHTQFVLCPVYYYSGSTKVAETSRPARKLAAGSLTPRALPLDERLVPVRILSCCAMGRSAYRLRRTI